MFNPIPGTTNNFKLKLISLFHHGTLIMIEHLINLLPTMLYLYLSQIKASGKEDGYLMMKYRFCCNIQVRTSFRRDRAQTQNFNNGYLV